MLRLSNCWVRLTLLPMPNAQYKAVSQVTYPEGNWEAPVVGMRAKVGLSLKDGELTGIRIVQGLCVTPPHLSIIIHMDNVLQHWCVFHMQKGWCLVLPCPVEREDNCKDFLATLIPQLVRYLGCSASHIKWVQQKCHLR